MALPVHAKKVARAIVQRPLRATDVLYQKMHVYNNEAKTILNTLIDLTKTVNKNSPALRELYLLMRKADDIVIDCAHKLAPYQSPKLETIEVRNKVEHRFVLRAPKPIASVEEWTKQTGAERARVEEAMAKSKDLAPEAPSVHDFEDDECSEVAERDEITTRRLLN
jgi:hypothetical protein